MSSFLAESLAGVTGYMGCLGEWQVPYVQSTADRTADVVQGQSSRASALVRTLGVHETKNTIPRGLNEQEICRLKKTENFSISPLGKAGSRGSLMPPGPGLPSLCFSLC